MNRSLLKILVILFCSLLLAGCWDYKEIEFIDFVFGFGVDKLEPDFVLVTEMMVPKGTGQEAKYEPTVLSTKGRSLSSATRALMNPAGMEAFYPHAQVFLVSEEVARDGVLPAIESAVRGRDLRTTIPFLVAKDCTVEEIFRSKPPFATSVSEHLASITRLQALFSTFYPQQVWEFTKDMVAIGLSATLPTVQLVGEGVDLVPIVKGTAVFKLDRMVGWLDGEESQIFCLLKGMPQAGRFVMETKINEDMYPITYEFINNATEISPEVDGDRLSVKIGVELEFDVTEIGTAEINFHDTSIVSSMEEQLAHYFNRRIREILGKIQREYNSDILGFGQMVRRKEPDFWRQHSDDWDTHLLQLPVDVEVRTRIVHTGVRAYPIVPRH